MRLRWLGAIVGMSVAGVVMADPAVAITYQYDGSEFTNFSGPTNIYDGSMSISGWFTLAAPLGSNVSVVYQPSAPVSFSFSDGVNTITSANSTDYGIRIETDGSGNISLWRVDLQKYIVGNPLLPNNVTIIACNTGQPICGTNGAGGDWVDTSASADGSLGGGSASNETLGTWSIAPAAPEITSNGGGDTAAVDVAENTTAVTDVQSTDESDSEGSGLTYSLTTVASGGADNSLFSIDPSSGVLTFKSAPNFESPTDDGPNGTYDVQVTVTDSGGLTDVQDIAVTVTDVVETGTITIVKNTAPAIAGDDTFIFVSSDAGLNGLSITTIVNTGTSLATVVPRGAITVTENEVTGWRLDGIVCNGDDNPTYEVGDRKVTIDLDDHEVVTCTFTNVRDGGFVVERTQRVISNFLVRRADLITSNNPNLRDRLPDHGGGANAGLPFGIAAIGSSEQFNLAFATSLSEIRSAEVLSAGDVTKAVAQAALGQMAVTEDGDAKAMTQAALGQLMAYGEDTAADDFETAQYLFGPQIGEQNGDQGSRFDVWAEGQWAHTDDETRESDFALLNFGADYVINPSLLVGVLAQIDWMDETDTTEGTAADGVGWMVGPYVVARLHENLLFDGRVAWG